MDRKLAIALGAGGGTLALGLLALALSRSGGGKTGGWSLPALPTMTGGPARRSRGYITLDGRRIPTSFPVNHSRKFRVGTSGTGFRNQPLVGGVLHWTAAENPGNRVFSTLSTRGISVHFAMDPDGTVWQYADPGRVYTLNAGRSLGQKTWAIEIANYGMASPSRIPTSGRSRGTYQAPVHGRMRTIADFRPVQKRNLFELADLIHTELRIPKRVLVEPDAFIRWNQLRNADGVMAHYHASDDKADPGPQLLDELAAQPGWTAYRMAA
jgi:N-acetylmuramoyl-L-alanine amidase-like protein